VASSKQDRNWATQGELALNGTRAHNVIKYIDTSSNVSVYWNGDICLCQFEWQEAALFDIQFGKSGLNSFMSQTTLHRPETDIKS
jgi:hypothetical protein